MLKHKIAKKYWLKHFSQEDIEKINRSFISAMSIELGKNYIDNSENIEDLNSLFSVYGKFCHPERDIEDETLGIEPKRLKKYVTEFGYDNLDQVFFCLNILYAKNQTVYMDEAGFIDWDKAFKREFFKDKKPLSIEEYVLLRTGDKRFNKIEYLLIQADKIEPFIDKKEKDWTKFKNMVPKSLALFILADPEKFSMKRIRLLEKYLKSKKIFDLSTVDQIKFSKTISVFSDFFIENGAFIKFEDYFSKEQFLDIHLDKDIISNVGDFKLSVKIYRDLLNIHKKLARKDLIDMFNANLKKIRESDRKLSYVSDLSRLLKNRDQFKFLLELTQRQIYNFNLFHLANSTEALSYMIDTWAKRAKKKKYYVDPIKSGKYEISILDVLDKEVFFLGDYTDCCQNIDIRYSTEGRTCITAGIVNENNGFVQVKKGSQVYAQSWFWEGINKEGEKYICFDSIENVGSTLEQKETLMKLYEDLSLKIFEKYSEVRYTCFGDSNRISDKIIERYNVVTCNINNDFVKDKIMANYTDTNTNLYVTRLLKRNENGK